VSYALCSNVLAQARAWEECSAQSSAAAAGTSFAAHKRMEQLRKLAAAACSAWPGMRSGDSRHSDVLCDCIASALTRAVADTQGREFLLHLNQAYPATSGGALWDCGALHACLLATAASPVGKAARNKVLGAALALQLELARKLQDCLGRLQQESGLLSQKPGQPRSRSSSSAGNSSSGRAVGVKPLYFQPTTADGKPVGAWVLVTEENCACVEGVLLTLAW
jgi:hypothetical protein